MAPSILVVDDEVNVALTLGAILADEGFHVDDATSFDDAVEKLSRGRYDMALLDLRLGEHDGLEILAHVKEISPETVVLVLTGYGSMETAIQAMRSGACDYLLKPCNLDELRSAVSRGLGSHATAAPSNGTRPADPEADAASQESAEGWSVMAHELRTPLSAVLGWAQYLERCLELGRLDQARLRAPLLVGQTRRLARLVEGLLDLEQIERGDLRLSYRHLDLGQLAEQATRTARLAYPRYRFHLTAPVRPVTLLGDAARLGFALSAVLDCAAKCSVQTEEVQIKVFTIGGLARFEVVCPGDGSSAAALSQALQVLRQERGGLSWRHPGVNLSLWCARALVEAHGGRIEADGGGPDGRLTLTIELPLAE